jgi:uncharacterized membrane protein
MRKRLCYLLAGILLLALEICIGLFVHDRFIRPYVGDVLVTALLCCLCRAAFPRFSPVLSVFLLSAMVELWQWLHLTDLLGLTGTLLGTVLGSTADWRDLVCYTAGCLLFSLAEHFLMFTLER